MGNPIVVTLAHETKSAFWGSKMVEMDINMGNGKSNSCDFGTRKKNGILGIQNGRNGY
jgi:hypothetical protein